MKDLKKNSTPRLKLNPEAKAKENHEYLVSLLEEGKLKPKISKIIGLENAEEAIKRLNHRKVVGKVVVIVSHDQ